MRRVGVLFLAAASVLMLSACALASDNRPETPAPSANRAGAASPSQTREVGAGDFDPRNFPPVPKVDNKWSPLRPGTQFIYQGSTQEGRERVPHRVIFTVTDLTKVINGVRAIVGWDRDYSDGELVEAELIFLAQDNDGNVWHLGQYSETWEGREFVGGQAWLAGSQGAKAGVFMKADPRVGTRRYSQGYAPPPFYWADVARVYKVGQRTCVPVRCYGNVLVIDESDRREPGAHQLKFYAPDVGNVRVGWRGARETERETLVLVKLVHFGPRGLAKVRAEALKLEARAYVYGRTKPAQTLAATRR